MGKYIALQPIKVDAETTLTVGEEVDCSDWGRSVDQYILAGAIYYQPEDDELYEGAWPNSPLGGVGHPTVSSKLTEMPAVVAEAYDMQQLLQEELTAAPDPSTKVAVPPAGPDPADEIELSKPAAAPASGSGKTTPKKNGNRR